MATSVILRNDIGIIKKGYDGFSWTCFFFGFFVPLFRGDIKWAVISLIGDSFTFGLFNIFLSFKYNEFYTNELRIKGFKAI